MADADLVALYEAYRDEIIAIRGVIGETALQMWDDLDDYYDASIDRIAGTVALDVTAAQREIGALTDVYLSERQSIATGTVTRPTGVPAALLTDQAIRGVDVLDVYKRMGPEVWTALSRGAPLDKAIAAGRRRLEVTTQTDLQLAKTHASQYSGQQRGVTYFRRELEGSKSCGLCIVASTQRYHVGDLMPIHGGCDCTVSEIYADADPGQILEPERLEGVHAAIKSTFGAYSDGAREIPGTRHPTRDDLLQYRDVLVTHRHGEIGPVLGVKGQRFTGPSDI